jgi:endonuclease YncB( thermonuclease family)
MILSLALSAACIARVHDGDTIRTCAGERIRLENIDAPELRGSERCSAYNRRRLAHGKNPAWCDFALGEQSRDALATFLAAGPVRIRRNGTDRYGRTLATLSVNGRDAGRYLITLGLARRWQ